MSKTLASARYARALFKLAENEKELPRIEALLADLAKTAAGHPEVISITQNPTLRESEKSAFIEKIVPADSPALFKNFLRVLLEKKRFPILNEIQSEFHRLFEKKRGVLEVELLSVVSFSKTLQEKLKKVLENKLRSSVRFVPKTDPSLLGGFLLRFDGREIDCSFKNRIEEIEQQLAAQEGTF